MAENCNEHKQQLFELNDRAGRAYQAYARAVSELTAFLEGPADDLDRAKLLALRTEINQSHQEYLQLIKERIHKFNDWTDCVVKDPEFFEYR
jgi:hypothetical protein